MNIQIEVGKYYKTRDGRKVRVYTNDSGGDCDGQIHGAFQASDGLWFMRTWAKNGSYIQSNSFHEYDITAEWTDAPDVPWGDYAAWWKWVAMDGVGLWHYFSEKPDMFPLGWMLQYPFECYKTGYIGGEYAPKFTGEWKQSLVQRPEK